MLKGINVKSSAPLVRPVEDPLLLKIAEKTQGCKFCSRDQEFLRQGVRPDYGSGKQVLSIVDLFAGAGGFSLGISEACRRLGVGANILLAIDYDEASAGVFRENFPNARMSQEPAENIFSREPGESFSAREANLRKHFGGIDLLIGGPPCQGHSDLNNKTRRNDPRNSLYVKMIRAAEVLRARAVVIENVPAVVHDR